MASLPAGKTVLVVEDVPLLRMMAVDMIEEAGFTVLEAADIESAIRILEKRLDIGVVFTDVDMPRGLDGMKFAAIIRDRWPPIEIIITSGKQWIQSQNLPERAVFFPKPYFRDQIVAQIGKMLAAH